MQFFLVLLLIFATVTVFKPETTPFFELGTYLLLAATLLTRPRLSWRYLLVLTIPAWGLLQLATHTTASTSETRSVVLRWGALAAVFIISYATAERRVFLNSLLSFATALAILCLAQLFTSHGHILWFIDSGNDEIFGTFPYHNNYAEFVELALPIALWRALREHRGAIWYALAGGVLYASVIAVNSRAGTIMCTLEVLAILAIGLVRLRTQRTTAMLAVVPALAIIFTLVVGPERVWEKFQQRDPYVVRREFLIAAVDMTKAHPLIGSGLGTFPEVYQSYAIRDFPFYANHTHDDWAEFAAEGGLPFLLLVLIPFVLAVPAAVRHPWALGLVAVMLHACVDYPFPRPAVSGWIFALLGILYARENQDHLLAAGSPPPDCDS